MITMPEILVQVGLSPGSPVQSSGSFRLGDATNGKLGGPGTLGTFSTWSNLLDVSDDVRNFTISVPSTREEGPLWNYQASTITITLDNSRGDYDPSNRGGPFFGQLSPMVPVRVLVNFGSASYSLYSGFADGWLPAGVTEPAEYAELTISATDAFKVLAGITLAAVAITGAGDDTGARIRDILIRAGWYNSAERLNIDTGNSNLQGTTLGDTALALMQLAADSEIGQLYCDGNGAVVFRSRHAVLTDARSNTVQAVFGDAPGTSHPAGTELYYASVTRANDDTRIVNDVQATIDGGTLQEVTDAASIAKYLFPRVYERSDLILEDDSDARNWAQWVVYVNKDEENRIESIIIDPAADPVNLWPQVLGRIIGDRIQVWHRPPSLRAPSWAWSFPNAGTPAANNYFIVTQAQAASINDGDGFRLFTSGGSLRENTQFSVTDVGVPFAGFVNITFSPAAQAAVASTDSAKQDMAAITQDSFVTGIQHDWNAADNHWITTWMLADADRYGSFLTLDNPTLGKLGSNALAF